MTPRFSAGLLIGALMLVVLTAGASAFVTQNILKAEDEKPAVQKTVKKDKARGNEIAWNEPRREAPAPAPQAKACDDGNIVGYVLGGAAGGIAGNQIGKGNGNTAATIGGTLGGAYLGGEYIPTRNITCR